ncbi:MAG: ATP-binding protein [Myxococcota bacterium]|nr:ATP-binding protein [Myxococcota bacterium]
MDFQAHVEHRLQIATTILGLAILAKEVLRILAMVDCKNELAEEIRRADVFDRPGVLSWKTLAEQVPASQNTLQPLERAVISLADWGLIQIVGRSITDPIAPGPSALRLSYTGRVCIGLAPAFDLPNVSETPSTTWQILHASSKERLIHECNSLYGSGKILVATKGGSTELDRLCGTIAVHLCTQGFAIIDGFPASDAIGAHYLSEMMRRTQTATRARTLLLPDPLHIRNAALKAKAKLRWVEPNAHIRRDRVVLDLAITEALYENKIASREHDLCGVPDSDIAQPKRCNTQWDDLILAPNVQFQLKQAMKHAEYRLNVLPQLNRGKKTGYRLLLSGLPGTGKSMTAEALATALDRPLVKFDLSSVLSKWLGETEKLIGQVFDVAEAASAVLVLDEAEAILRQRGNNSNSGGGLSTGVAYMLTRFDRYEGVLVATTNRIEDLDEAFFRRFDDYAVLPIPDRDTREGMWKSMLGNKEGDTVNYQLLARNFAISGGLIKGASIRARAWSTGMQKPLSTPFVLASLARELEKNNRSTNEAFTREHREQVEALLEGDFSLIDAL